MFRFISFLLGREWEPCKSCENLKQQLEFERSEKRLLIDTLVNIVKPKEVEAAAPIEINQIQQSSALFSRRRQALEEADRKEAQILAQKKNLGIPDDVKKFISIDGDRVRASVAKLEEELGIEEGEAN
jgi:hypothetical protein